MMFGRDPRIRHVDLEEDAAAIEAAIATLRGVVAEVRGRRGRDFIRAHPHGFFLDAIDVGRDTLFPGDARGLVLQADMVPREGDPS